jgi:hypothetical protein
MVRFPLVHAGGIDVAALFEENKLNDESTQVLGDLLSAWHARFGSEPITVGQLVEVTERSRDADFNQAGPVENDRQLDHELTSAVQALYPDSGLRQAITAKSLGAKFRGLRDRIVDGMSLERIPGNERHPKWCVVRHA